MGPDLETRRQHRLSTPDFVLPAGGPPRWAAELPSQLRGDAPPKEIAAAFVGTFTGRLGVASFARLKELVQSGYEWALPLWKFEKGSRAKFLWSTFRRAYEKLLEEVPLQLLVLEWLDDRKIAAARTGDPAAVERWLCWVHDEIRRRRNRLRRTWRVPGLKFDDLLGEVDVALLSRLERMRKEEADAWPEPKPGRSRSLELADLVRNKLRRRRHLAIANEPAAVISFTEQTRSEMRAPTPQRKYFAQERKRETRLLFEAVRQHRLVSQRERDWLSSFEEEAKSTETDSVTLSAVARRRGVSPSAASKMREKLDAIARPLAHERGLLELDLEQESSDV